MPRKRWPALVTDISEKMPRTRRKLTGNQLASQQEEKKYFCVNDEQPDAGDWYVIGERPGGDQIVIGVRDSEQAANNLLAFLIQQGIEGYTGFRIELSMHSSTGKRNY